MCFIGTLTLWTLSVHKTLASCSTNFCLWVNQTKKPELNIMDEITLVWLVVALTMLYHQVSANVIL